MLKNSDPKLTSCFTTIEIRQAKCHFYIHSTNPSSHTKISIMYITIHNWSQNIILSIMLIQHHEQYNEMEAGSEFLTWLEPEENSQLPEYPWLEKKPRSQVAIKHWSIHETSLKLQQNLHKDQFDSNMTMSAVVALQDSLTSVIRLSPLKIAVMHCHDTWLPTDSNSSQQWV